MTGGIPLFLLILLGIMLLYAAWGDWQRRDIPNWLTLSMALTAPLYWWAMDFPLWPNVAIIVGIAIGLFLAFLIPWMLNAMGGGDVKMISALALWLTPLQLPSMLIVMALSGGAITLMLMIHARVTKQLNKPEIPYGIAIAIGGLFIVVNEILTIAALTP